MNHNLLTSARRAQLAGAVLLATLAPVVAAHAQSQPATPAEMVRNDSGRPAYTAADVRFMQGMIGHHSQAVTMAAMAPTHGAGADIRVLAERIDVAQRDEIAFMQRWLRERHETAPDPLAKHVMPDGSSMAGHDMSSMPGMNMGAMMPGMLTPAQMAQLDESRGAEFDRLFLTFMMQHHTGALEMVDTLFAAPGAGQDVAIFRFASDVTADQTTEIDRMRLMLDKRTTQPTH